MKQWLDEFSWRILAVQRVFRDDEVAEPTPKKSRGKAYLTWKKALSSSIMPSALSVSSNQSGNPSTTTTTGLTSSENTVGFGRSGLNNDKSCSENTANSNVTDTQFSEKQ